MRFGAFFFFLLCFCRSAIIAPSAPRMAGNACWDKWDFSGSGCGLTGYSLHKWVCHSPLPESPRSSDERWVTPRWSRSPQPSLQLSPRCSPQHSLTHAPNSPATSSSSFHCLHGLEQSRNLVQRVYVLPSMLGWANEQFGV